MEFLVKTLILLHPQTVCVLKNRTLLNFTIHNSMSLFLDLLADVLYFGVPCVCCFHAVFTKSLNMAKEIFNHMALLTLQYSALHFVSPSR